MLCKNILKIDIICDILNEQIRSKGILEKKDGGYMVFSSDVFLFAFFPLLFVLYYNPFCKGRGFRNVVLVLASLGFYAWGEPVFVLVMLAAILVSWWCGQRISYLKQEEQRKQKKLVLSLGIGFFLCLLFGFKYLSFCMRELGILLHAEWRTLSIPLPAGVSFFTFQCMSYLFDIYYGKAEAQKNILKVGLYVSLFPQLIAGPIVRYEQIAGEIEQRRESRKDIVEGMERFIFGLGKKVLLANYMAVIADNLFYGNINLAMLTAWLGAIAYALQIYFDFSGYSDMAIGLGRVFGFHFKENFYYPYVSGSITEFWRRWHISLSGWFRDYVYIPLGGNRVKQMLWIRNLFVVWFLTGIWHGANWTFLVWGLFYFVCLLTEKLTGLPEKLEAGALGIRAIRHLYTMAAVVIAWVMFRADTVTKGIQYIGWMFGIDSAGVVDAMFLSYLQRGGILFFIAVLFAMPVYPLLKKKCQRIKGKMAEVAGSLLIIGVFLLSLLVVVSSSYNPFIYFNF